MKTHFLLECDNKTRVEEEMREVKLRLSDTECQLTATCSQLDEKQEEVRELEQSLSHKDDEQFTEPTKNDTNDIRSLKGELQKTKTQVGFFTLQ